MAHTYGLSLKYSSWAARFCKNYRSLLAMLKHYLKSLELF